MDERRKLPMVLHYKSLMEDLVKNRNDRSPVNIYDLKILLLYIDAIRKDFEFREDQLRYALHESQEICRDMKDTAVTRTEFEEMIRERIYPLHVAITGEKPKSKDFNPISMENMA